LFETFLFYFPVSLYLNILFHFHSALLSLGAFRASAMFVVAEFFMPHVCFDSAVVFALRTCLPFFGAHVRLTSILLHGCCGAKICDNLALPDRYFYNTQIHLPRGPGTLSTTEMEGVDESPSEASVRLTVGDLEEAILAKVLCIRLSSQLTVC